MSRLIPGIFCSLQKGERPLIRNPQAVRPWQNVLDVTDALLLLAAETAAGSGMRIYNVGPEEQDAWTVAEIGAYISGLYGADTESWGHQAAGVREHRFLRLNIEKLRRELGWSPRRRLRDTLDEIYRFYTGRRIADARTVSALYPKL